MVKTFRYASGFQGVISPCTLTGYTPAPVTEDWLNADGTVRVVQLNSGPVAQTMIAKNGAMLNPGAPGSSGQGFTSRSMKNGNIGPYSAVADLGANLPVAFAEGEEGSIVVTTFDEKGDDKGTGPFTQRDIITVVSAANSPPVGAFRPAPAAISKASTHTISDIIDLATLPALPMPGRPSFLVLVGNLRWDTVAEFGNGAAQWKAQAPNNVSNLWKARGLGPDTANATLFLCSDAPVAEKLEVAKVLCQRAIDLKERLDVMIAEGQTDWGGIQGAIGLGGVNQGQEKLCLLVGGTLFNDAAMIALGQLSHFAEDGSTMVVTQSKIDNPVSPPGNQGGGFAEYIQEDLDAPEWTQANGFKQNAGNRLRSDSYRADNAKARVVASLAIQLWPALYNNYPAGTRDLFLDYSDRLMERDFFKLGDSDPSGQNVFQFARTLGGTKAIPGWALTAWDNYRANVDPLIHGQTAIWDWPV